MFVKAVAVSALLAGSAVAVPYPSPVEVAPTRTATEVDFSIGGLEARQLGGKVTNNQIANWNYGNIQDGVGSGRDEYKMYWGDGSTGAGWPDRNKWVSFENM